MIQAYLNQPVTIERIGVAGQDRYGNDRAGVTATVTTTALLQQTTSTEVVVDRDTLVSDWLGIFPAGTVLSHLDRVAAGPLLFEVVGRPDPKWNPRMQRYQQVEARLRAVTG